MLRYLARRATHAVPVLFGVSLIAFLLLRLVPGDPILAMLGNNAPTEAIAHWRSYYGLDDPLPLQYVGFLNHILTLDFGNSIALKTSVNSLIAGRAGTTVVLIIYAVTIAILLAVPLAMYSARHARRTGDNAVKIAMMVSFAMPAFWLGLVLVLIFSIRLGWFPTSGQGTTPLTYIWSLTLPALTIGLAMAPVLIRTLRSSMIESLQAEFVEAARARGLSDRRVMSRYVLRTSLISTVTIVGLNIGFLIGGSVVVENVFGLAGIGSLLVHAVQTRDFPLVEAGILLIGVAVVLLSLLTDLVNAALDPRIRR